MNCGKCKFEFCWECLESYKSYVHAPDSKCPLRISFLVISLVLLLLIANLKFIKTFPLLMWLQWNCFLLNILSIGFIAVCLYSFIGYYGLFLFYNQLYSNPYFYWKGTPLKNAVSVAVCVTGPFAVIGGQYLLYIILSRSPMYDRISFILYYLFPVVAALFVLAGTVCFLHYLYVRCKKLYHAFPLYVSKLWSDLKERCKKKDPLQILLNEEIERENREAQLLLE